MQHKNTLDTIFPGISVHYYNGYKRKYLYFSFSLVKCLLCNFWEHVEYEIHVRCGTLRSQTDLKILALCKIDFLRIGNNYFCSYNGFITDFCCFYRFSIFLNDYLGDVLVTIESQSGWRLNEDIQFSHPVSLGQLRIIVSPFWTYTTAKNQKVPKIDFASKTWHGM